MICLKTASSYPTGNMGNAFLLKSLRGKHNTVAMDSSALGHPANQ
jgi:hypothetical protein